MAILGVDDFKAKLRGGGARPNLFQVTINYPGFADGNPELTSFLVEAAGTAWINIRSNISTFPRSPIKNGRGSYIC